MTAVNREQAGYLAFHNGRSFRDHEYSPGSLSEREWQAGWIWANEGVSWDWLVERANNDNAPAADPPAEKIAHARAQVQA